MIKTTNLPINVGAQVSFDSDYGPQTGHVIDFIPCLVNGREHARVEIDTDLPGIVHHVPADTLQLIPNLVFLTGAANPFNAEVGDRRYFALKDLPPVTPSIASTTPLTVPPYLQNLLKRVQP